jgi:hypothetical protein
MTILRLQKQRPKGKATKCHPCLLHRQNRQATTYGATVHKLTTHNPCLFLFHVFMQICQSPTTRKTKNGNPLPLEPSLLQK